MTNRVQELPRLTGALRAFGDVSKDFGNEEGKPLSKALSGKRKKRIRGKEQDWPTLTQQLLDRCSKADMNEVCFFSMYSLPRGVCTCGACLHYNIIEL